MLLIVYIILLAVLAIIVVLYLKRHRLQLSDLNKKLKGKVYQLSLLFDATRSLVLNLNLDKTYEEILKISRHIISPEAFCLLGIVDDQQKFTIPKAVGFSSETLEKIAPFIYRNIIEPIQKNKTLFTSDNFPLDLVSKDFAFTGPAGALKGFLGIPLIVEDKILGSLVVFSFDRKSYLESEKQLLFTLGAYAALAIENSRRYEELLRLNRLKSDFISLASHELYTPITALKGSVSLISDSSAEISKKEQETMLTIALANTERLYRLINNIIDISKLERGGAIKLSKEHCHLKEVIENNIETLKKVNLEKKIDFKFNVGADFPSVIADEKRINQVIFNLLENAVKFSSVGGKIEISLSLNNTNEVCIEIVDNGQGIPAHLRENIFEPFALADPLLSQRSSGLGLGLALSKGIIEAHGGKIWVESKEDRGSRFIFTLPIS